MKRPLPPLNSRSPTMVVAPKSWATPAVPLRYLGDVSRGGEILKQAVELDPSNAQAQVALGAALALSGDLDGGIACMRHGIKLSPRDRRLAFWGMGTRRVLDPSQTTSRGARRSETCGTPGSAGRSCRRSSKLAHAALGQTDAAEDLSDPARRLRPQPTLHEVEISDGHGR